MNDSGQVAGEAAAFSATGGGLEPGGLAEVFVMAYPSVVTMFAYALMGVADSAMVGRLGTSELAAVGFTHMLFFATIALFMGMVEIVNTFASQFHGAGDRTGSARAGWQGVYLALAAWPVLAGIGLLYPALFRLLAPSTAVQELGGAYGMIRLAGVGPFLVFVGLASFFRGVSMVRTPMALAVIMNALNVGLDYILIFGKMGLPAMGVKGAAWATNISCFVAMVMGLAVFVSPWVHKRFNTRAVWRPDFRLIARMVRVGLPAGVHFMMDVAGFTVFFTIIGRMGDTSLAASQVSIQIEALGFNVCWGFTVATTTLVGQYLGAGRPDLAQRAVKSTYRIMLIYLLSLLTVITLFPGPLVALFSADPNVENTGAMILYLAMTYMLFDGTGIVAVGALRGAGDTRWPMIVAVLASWGFFLPGAYFVSTVLHHGVLGAWAVAAIYIIGVSSAYFGRYAGGKWKRMKI